MLHFYSVLKFVIFFLDCPSQSPNMAKSKSKMMKRGHVHRRSGSMTITKKVLDEATIVEPELPPTYEVTPTNPSVASSYKRAFSCI